MTTKDEVLRTVEALKLALEALEDYVEEYGPHEQDSGVAYAITAIRAALASKSEALADSALERMAENARELGLDYEPAPQEPVAVYVGETWCGSVVRLYEDLPLETPLYASPPASKPWVGLTDEEMRDLEKQFNAERVRTSDEEYLIIYPGDYWAWQRAIEAKLREKNA